jgi:hypothetical protein
MDDLGRMEGECSRLQDEARRRGTWGWAIEFARIGYLINQAEAMKTERMPEESSRG